MNRRSAIAIADQSADLSLKFLGALNLLFLLSFLFLLGFAATEARAEVLPCKVIHGSA